LEQKENAIFEGTDNPEGFNVSTDFYENYFEIPHLIFNNNSVYYQQKDKVLVFKKEFLIFKKLFEISASQENIGNLVKVFEDHLYFLMKDKGQISVLSYSHDRKYKNVTTKEEVLIKLATKVIDT
jgi:hypothetical protein